jgi:hypothetical protein
MEELERRIIEENVAIDYICRADHLDLVGDDVYYSPEILEKFKVAIERAKERVLKIYEVLFKELREKNWYIEAQIVPSSVENWSELEEALYTRLNPCLKPLSIEISSENPRFEDIDPEKELCYFKTRSALSWGDINRIQDFKIDLIYSEEEL